MIILQRARGSPADSRRRVDERIKGVENLIGE